jgi:hypothetical protein
MQDKAVQHELTITHDLRFIARPFGINCSCGFNGAAETYAEAERVLKHHQERETQKAKEQGA